MGYSKPLPEGEVWRKCGDLYYLTATDEAYVHMFSIPVIQRVLGCKVFKSVADPPFLQGDLVFSRPEIEDVTVGMITSTDNHEGAMYHLAFETMPVAPNHGWILRLTVRM